MRVDLQLALDEVKLGLQTGAPYTTIDHPLHSKLRELEQLGRLRSFRVGQKTYWRLTEENKP